MLSRAPTQGVGAAVNGHALGVVAFVRVVVGRFVESRSSVLTAVVCFFSWGVTRWKGTRDYEERGGRGRVGSL